MASDNTKEKQQLKVLTRDEILGADDIQIWEVEVPEWGGIVLCKSLTAAQVERVQNKFKGKGMKGVTAALVAMAVVDEDGKRVFHQNDLPELSTKSITACTRVLKVIMEQNAMEEEDLEELAKNSDDGQTEDLLSD